MTSDLQVNQQHDLIAVLRSSLYPGASAASIEMVLGYCKAAGLDPMQKPVHIVPMWDGKAKAMRDVVMPGIGLYRTQAARTGQFAGMSEPEFGPDITEKIGGQEVKYPEWARVTVKRALSTGIVAEFTAVEFWRENYAVKGGAEKSVAPNAMWTKRPRGQIAKCAEAQALRKAFPEVGSQPTAEEMTGKAIDDDAPTVQQPDKPQPPAELLQRASAAAERGVRKYEEFWQGITRNERKLLGAVHDDLKLQAAEADDNEKLAAGTSTVDPDTGEITAEPANTPVDDPFVKAMQDAEAQRAKG